MTNRVFRRDKLFGCHDKKTKREREREKERERDKKERNIVTKETLRHRKEGKKRAMHEYVTCKTKKHHGQNPIQLNSTHKI